MCVLCAENNEPYLYIYDVMNHDIISYASTNSRVQLVYV